MGQGSFDWLSEFGKRIIPQSLDFVNVGAYDGARKPARKAILQSQFAQLKLFSSTIAQYHLEYAMIAHDENPGLRRITWAISCRSVFRSRYQLNLNRSRHPTTGGRDRHERHGLANARLAWVAQETSAICKSSLTAFIAHNSPEAAGTRLTDVNDVSL
jgi:hypothetical protein